MSKKEAKTWQQAKLLNAYYIKVAKAAVNQGGCPRFTSFRAGFAPQLEGPLDERGNPTVADIPAGMQSVPNEFYRGIIEGHYSGDTALAVCEIPKNAAPSPVKFNFIGIFDQDDDMVAACVTLTDWLTPEELDRSYLAVTFPIEEEAAS